MSLNIGNSKPGSNTVLTSVVGMAFHAAGFLTALSPLLAGTRYMVWALLAAAALNSLGGFLGNAGSIGAKRGAEAGLEKLANATAEHVEEAIGPAAAEKIRESVQVPGGQA